MPVVYNLGSLNLDRVVRVPHLVRAGETLAGSCYRVFAGGKGANQSVALARAGARVRHIGRVGEDGRWLVERLASEGIDTSHIAIGSTPSGQALIQVDDDGQNAIVVIAGANAEITPAAIDAALAQASPGDWLLLQNETSNVAHAMRSAKQRGLHVAFNPAPCDESVQQYPLECVDLLCVNETEAADLARTANPAAAAPILRARLPNAEILLTRGAAGASHYSIAGETHQAAAEVTAIDTTAAGDTFLGYYLATSLTGQPPKICLEQATKAAALCVARPGAQDSIPRIAEVRT